MRRLNLLLLAALCAAVPHAARPCAAQTIDSDRDGLDDGLEQALLDRFAPRLMVSGDDCSALPARFAPGIAVPRVVAEDGTLYGQAFPHAGGIELHFYELWRTDCGRMGHPLDAEHVSVLLQGHGTSAAGWRAVYWYAAAHEDTVCDASQMTRASTLHAETHGPAVWLSTGKHASFLTEEMCRHGCGGDRCTNSVAVPAQPVINLGEDGAAMNGAAWAHAPAWPLEAKMRRSDFLAVRTARVDRLPATDIAWANPAKRPAQAAILGGNTAVNGAAVGGSAAGTALAAGGHSADTALVVAGGSVGNALGTAAGATRGALGTAAKRTGHALGGALHTMRKAPDAAPAPDPR